MWATRFGFLLIHRQFVIDHLTSKSLLCADEGKAVVSSVGTIAVTGAAEAYCMILSHLA